MKHLHLLLYFIMVFLLVSGQDMIHGQSGVINGKTIDSKTLNPVEYSSILNYSRHNRVYSNAAGEFMAEAEKGDTIILYAVSYLYKKIIADEEVFVKDHQVLFPMDQMIYEIEEAHIMGIGTYEEFKQQVLNLKRSDTKSEILNENIAELSRKEAVDASDRAKEKENMNKISIMRIPIRTPEERERIKLAEIIENEKIQDQVYQKFNPLLIKQVTGLTDDDEIIEFIHFCGFTDKYILEVNEYDLIELITKKFETFQKMNKKERSLQNQKYQGKYSFLYKSDNLFSSSDALYSCTE
jgi:hypothetical protein